jgi:hypothetical protein
MKFPPSHSRAHIILTALLAGPATFHQGVERHSLMKFTEQKIRDIYEQLEVDGWLIKSGAVYAVSQKARLRLVPPSKSDVDVTPTAPAYRGNWHGSVLNASSARRTGAAFGIDWFRS